MNQIKSIQLGVIAICMATVPLSLAQTRRTGTSGSNPPAPAAVRAPGASIGNSIRAPQIGINAGSATITGPTTNAGVHTGISAGAQTGISNQAIGITRAATGLGALSGISAGTTQTGINAGNAINTGAHTATNVGAQTGIGNQGIGITRPATGNSGSSGNSMGATQTGINAATGTSTKANTNAGAQAGSATGAGTGGKNTQPQFILEPTQSLSFSTPTPAPTPIPAPTPVASPSFSPSPSPTP